MTRYCEFPGNEHAAWDEVGFKRLCQHAGFRKCTLHNEDLGQVEGFRTCCPSCVTPSYTDDKTIDQAIVDLLKTKPPKGLALWGYVESYDEATMTNDVQTLAYAAGLGSKILVAVDIKEFMK